MLRKQLTHLCGLNFRQNVRRVNQRYFSLSSATTSSSTTSYSRPPTQKDAVHVTASEIATYQQDGAVCLRNKVNIEWIQLLREAAEQNMLSPGPLCDEHAAKKKANFIYNSSIAHIHKQITGSTKANIFYDHLLVKEPGTPSPTPWHNDMSYWQLKGDQISTVWIALDRVPRDLCVSYVKGSHKWRLSHHITRFDGGGDRYKTNENRPNLPNIDEGVKSGKYQLLRWDMDVGDVLVHHCYAVHGAAGNLSTQRRRGYAVRFLGDDVIFDPRPGTMNDGWMAVGYDCRLTPGLPIDDQNWLHPRVA